LIPLLYYTSGKESLRYLALFLAAISFLSDALDGYLARKKGIKTERGAFLDPLGDKLLINSSFIVLILKPEFKQVLNLPIWVVGVVLLRDMFLALGSFILHTKSKLVIRPSGFGKFAVAFQMLSILSALLYLKFTSYLWIFTGIVTLLAGLGYFLREASKFYK
jgi:CDP-diacylglycerol--glycerol-3-phosphate 3-phosphatidyltransferase